MTAIVNYSHLVGKLGGEEAAAEISEGSKAAAAETAPEAAAMQAVADQIALNNSLAKLKDAEIDPEIFTAVNDAKTSLLQTFAGEESVKSGDATIRVDTREVTFDSRDIAGWAKSLFTWWRKFVPAIWQKAPAEPEQLPNNARIGLLGDWGTGLYGAPDCARSIENDPRPFDLLVHLGDVYYSGTEGEVRNRFLKFWPKKNVKVSRALNSNHEMYTGGRAYFQITLREFNQRASYFAMQNDRWLVIGLDSAYHDGDLVFEQADWVRSLAARAGNRRIVLMTHHQLFSFSESQGDKLAQKLADLLLGGRIFAWYWGHEHRCVLFEPHPTMKLHGRCIGHSGYPYFRDKFDGATLHATAGNKQWLRIPGHGTIPAGLLLDGANDHITKHGERYGPNGYLTLELRDDALVEHVYDADGTELLKSTLPR